jgi:hypothetical protein
MRNKPIIRDEVRLSDRGRIATLPLNSIHRDRPGLSPDPIEKLWAPLVQALNRQQDEHTASMKQMWGARYKAPKPIEVPRPDWRGPNKCRHCGHGFYNAQNCRGAFCSDTCIRAERVIITAKARSESRAAKRAGLKCETCGKRLAAQRSTARFCSVRCRVASHRVQKNRRLRST